MKKQKAWTRKDYKDFLFGLLRRESSYDNYRRVRISENFARYAGNHPNQAYQSLMTYHEPARSKEEGESNPGGDTPFKYESIDTLSPKIKLLIGEFISRGFEFNLSATSRKAVKRRQMWRNQLEMQRNLQQFYRKAAEYTGVEYGVNDNLPDSEEDLEAYMEEWRDIYESIMEFSIDESVYSHRYEHMRKVKMLDVVICGECHSGIDIKEGKVTPEWVSPFHAVYDRSGNSDYNADGSYFGKISYMSIPDAIREFNIPKDRMIELIDNYQNNNDGTINKDNSSWFAPFESRFGGWEGKSFDRVLVFEAQWKDWAEESLKESYDNAGEKVIDEYGPDEDVKLTSRQKSDPRTKVTTRPVEIEREGVLIANEYVVNYGVSPNTLRDPDNPDRSILKYTSYIHEESNNGAVSIIDRAKGLQDLRDYYWNVLQKEITTAPGSVIYVDRNRLDQDIYGVGEETMNKLIHTLKAHKVVVGNSGENPYDNIGGDGVPVKNIDIRASTIVSDIVSIITFLDVEIQKVTGINESRVGDIGERALASTTRIGLNQSMLQTESLFEGFRFYEQYFMDKWVKLQAIVFDNNPEEAERIAATLGYIDDIPNDFSFQGWKTKISTQPFSKAELQRVLEVGLSQGAIDVITYIEVLMEAQNGINRGLRKFIKEFRRSQKKAMQAAMQQQQAEAMQERDRQEWELERTIRSIREKGNLDFQKTKYQTDKKYNSDSLNRTQKDRSDQLGYLTAMRQVQNNKQ